MANKPSLDEIFMGESYSPSVSTNRKPSLDDIFSGKDVASDTPAQEVPSFGSSLRNNLTDATMKTLGGAALVGSGILAKKAFNAYRQPWDERNALIKQIEKEQSQLGISGTKASMLPKKVGELEREAKMNLSRNSQNISNRSRMAQGVLTQRLKDFDSTVLNSSVDDLAATIKGNYGDFFNGAYEGYRNGLEASELFLKDKGIELSTLDFDGAVIDKTVKDLTNKLPEDQLARIKPMLSDATKNERPLTIPQAKKYMDSIKKDLPVEAQRKLTENWGDFLEQKAVPEVKEQLSLLNSKYKPFAEARTKLLKLSSSKTGQFDDEGIYKFLMDYVKKGENQSKENLLKIISEGNEIVSPMAGVKDKVSKLSNLSKKRSMIEGAISQTGISTKNRLSVLRQKAHSEIDRLMSWKSKADELVSRARVAQKKVDARSVFNKIRGVPFVGGLVNKGLPILGAYGQVRDVLHGATLEDMAVAAANGMDIDEVIATRKASQKDVNSLTPEEQFLRWRSGTLL